MNVGVGLPNTTPGTDGALVLEWARRADAGPFSSVAVLDRVAYDGLEPFATLAAAAAATARVRLATMIAIARCARPPSSPSRRPRCTRSPGDA